MSLSLNNSVDIVANSVNIVEEQSLLDVRDGILTTANAIRYKADKTAVYVKSETYTQQEVNDPIHGLSDATVAGQPDLKAGITDVNRLLNLKAHKADVNTSVDVDELLAQKANKTYVDGKLNRKADANKTYTIAATDALLAAKATKAYVDAELNHKANANDTYTISQVNSVLATKADDDEVKAALDLKAVATDVYTKII